MSVLKKFGLGATLQAKRWLFDQRMEAMEQNDYSRLSKLLSDSRPCKCKEATAVLQRGILKKSDATAACVQLLLDKNASPNESDGRGSPFLVLAAESGCADIVNLLLKAGANPDLPRRLDFSTALHRAIYNNHLSCVQLLLAANANIESTDSQGRTPIVIAAQCNMTEALVYLINKKANTSSTDSKGRTALLWACRLGNFAVSNLICNTDERVINIADLQGNAPLTMATERGFYKIVNLLINKGANIDHVNDVGDTSLIMASKIGQRESLRLLLQANCDVNILNKNGTNAIFHCMTDIDMLSDLLQAGADPDLKLLNNNTVVGLLAARNSAECLHRLLQTNAECLCPVGESSGKIPIQIATEHGNLQSVQLLFIYCTSIGVQFTWLIQFLKTTYIQERSEQYKAVKDAVNWLDAKLQLHECVPNLAILCRGSVRACIKGKLFSSKVERLPLPSTLKKFIMLTEFDKEFLQVL